ncbi:MAG: DUF1292 domain-containing protein [Lactobacillales bacterium]|jgi:uncharacterized protein YrzB (UPF0473 family)|nr:DUF1292 domain-containing protein [Lactobacillales bacterium]
MAHTHDHEHAHDHSEEEVEPTYYSFEDEQGNEVLYEEVLRIDADEEFGKQYLLLTAVGLSEDDEEAGEVYAYSYVEQEDGSVGEIEPVESDAEWDLIEETFNTIYLEDDED